MIIRKATREDAGEIIAMGRALALESPKYRDMHWDEAKLMDLGERINSVLAADQACSFVAQQRGEMAGTMIIVVAERFFGGDLYVTDVTLYIKPEHRGGFVFARLVQAAEKWARERGVRDAAFGVSTEIDAPRTVRAYERMGYTVTGYTLTKTLAEHDDGH